MSFWSDWKEKREAKKAEKQRLERVQLEEGENIRRIAKIKELERKLQEGPARRKALKDELTIIRDEYEALSAEHKEKTKI